MSTPRLASPIQRRSTGRPAQISRAAIGEAALAEIDGLSSTKVAKRLGIGQSSLYRHITDRIDLVRLGVDFGLESVTWPEAGKKWRTYLEQVAEVYWKFLCEHPGIAREIKVLRPFSAELVKSRQTTSSALVSLGFDPANALLVVSLVTGITLDYAIFQDLLKSRGPHGRSVRDEQRAYLGAEKDREYAQHELDVITIEPKEQLDRALEVILDGAYARLANAATKRKA